ncbi:hypothetical protein [Melittangium boletus]|uniref:hypothetical protein n=1 Tax=Melittangium boletus TaxID=83453 RepID=UPI003DA62847
MPTLRSRLAAQGALALPLALLGVAGLSWRMDVLAPLSREVPWALWGMTGGVWLALGYAVGWLSRPRPAAAPPPAPETVDLSRFTTEQLYQELERLNRAALQAPPVASRAEPPSKFHSC